MVSCTKCGSDLKDTAKFCVKCGQPVTSVQKAAKAVKVKKNKPKAAPKLAKAAAPPVQASTPKNKALIAKAIAKGLTKSLTTSALVLGPGIAILMAGFQAVGMIWLFLGSFWLMARSYKKPWRLTVLSCLIPPVVTVMSYLVQLWLFSGEAFSLLAIGLAVVAGLLFGWWRGRSHQIYWEGNSLFAKRTYGYMVTWVLAYGFTQALAATASSVLLIRAGLVTGAFTTAVLMMVSVMLLRQRKAIVMPPMQHVAALILAGVFGLALLLPQSTWAASQDRREVANRELEKAIDSGNAADLYGAALATGLNDQLGITNLRRKRSKGSSPDTESYAGFTFSLAEFTARANGDKMEIFILTVTGQSFRTKTMVSMMAPTLLDEFHSWLLKISNEKGDEFAGTIARMNYGEYGLLINGPDKKSSIALAVMVADGRVVMVGYEAVGRRDRVQMTRSMAEATLNYLDRMYTAGPGTVTIPAGEATVATAATLVMLTTAGIAVSLVQSIAAATGQVVQVVAETTVNEVTSALDEQGLGDMPPPGDGQEDAPPDQPPPRRGPDLYDKEGETFARNEDGEYWAPNAKGDWEWMGENKARESSAALRGERQDREAEQRYHDRETDRMLKESREKIQAKNQQEEDEYLRQKWQQEQDEAAQEDHRERLVAQAKKMGEREGGDLEKEINQLVKDGGYGGLEDLYREKLEQQVTSGETDSASEQTWEKAMAVGEYASRGVTAAAKGALMVAGGPAGAAATGLAVGTVSAAEQGAESYVRGDSMGEVAARTAGGFLSGAKDGMVSVYGNLPGVGTSAKLLVGAAADATETYVRTGDGKQALISAGVSLAGDSMGYKIDRFGNVVGRELSRVAVTVAAAETTNYAAGGEFGDAYQNALINHLGGKIGSRAGTHFVNKAVGIAGPDPLARTQVDHEQRVRDALEGAEAAKTDIPLKNQAGIVQELEGSRHRAVVTDDMGRPRLDADGNEVTTEFVNTRKALEQLQDPSSSRSAKLGPEDLKQAIIDTRQKKIYDPADQETIRRVTPTLEQEGLLKPGDSIEMDSFSTPGKKPSLGADRDARLVIKRPNGKPVTDKQDGFDRIEIDRKHWEDIAHKEFFKHTTEIAKSGGQEITPETQPEYFRRRAEMEFMKRPDTPAEIEALQRRGFSQEQIAKLQQQGMTQDQIDAKAWAEAHNQLFTDRNHMEASADNADQAFVKAERGLKQVQGVSNVMPVADGKAKLLDPEGFARMWKEKSHFYDQNPPEALAQSQKGIDGLMRLRDGYRTQGLTPPPFTEQTARAMEIVARAKVGADATPDTIADLNRQMQGLGYKDLNDGLAKIAYQNELLKWSTELKGLSTSDLTRISQSSPAPFEDGEKGEGG
ncbi:MAG: zinc-ribbon domain-containing protein [Alphaproteobacteria bacterium]|nr:zinc-ribbon domain-containing protein [Alphaproteobacteria bacterium]